MKRNLKVFNVLVASMLFLGLPLTTNAQAGSDTTDINDLKVILYKIPNIDKQKVKKQALENHKEAMDLIAEYYKKDGINLSNNLDDKEYQMRVLQLGAAMNEFTEDEFEIILEFVKFIDLYENYDKNDRIKSLENKLKEKTINKLESLELKELLPINDRDETTLESATTEQNEENTFSIAASNGYNPTAARDYAYEWTDNDVELRNNDDFPYYSNYYGCYSCWNDCTNFVSQALVAGSMRQLDGYDWYYSNSGPSYSWGGANAFYKVWKVRAGVASSVSYLGVGDVVNADYNKDGDIDHSAIITSSTSSYSSGKWLTQHSTDREEETTLKDWYDSNYAVYGYEMDKAYNGY